MKPRCALLLGVLLGLSSFERAFEVAVAVHITDCDAAAVVGAGLHTVCQRWSLVMLFMLISFRPYQCKQTCVDWRSPP
jgi:hypothetical protein